MLVALAPLPWLGLGAAQAADTVTYATVTGYEPFSSEANNPEYWGDNCEKIFDAGGIDSYVLTHDYELVIVKAGASNVDPYTNTLFANASSGETVWADTNGNGVFDPGGQDGDKGISHIIACGPSDQSTSPSPSPSPSTSISTSASASPSTSLSTSASPTRSHSSSAAPSTSISSQGTGSPGPSKTHKTHKPNSSSPEATEIESSGAAALPHTGSDTPIAGAIGISLLLIGVGVLLLLGPGRLIPSTTYHRKH
jgi:LPXTG-motif cell wall-anchored protein